MNWGKVKLGEHIEVLSGFAFDSKLFNDSKGTPLVRIRDVGRNYSETYYDGAFDNRYMLNNGDLLVSMDGEFRIAEWKGGKGLLNQRVCKISPKNGTIEKKFLLYLMPFELFKIEHKTSFVTVKHLSVKDINSIEIPLPPPSIQKKIIAILDKTDELRKKDQQLLAKYDELLQSIFYDMFGNLVSNEKGWEKVKLKSLIREGDKINYGVVQPGDEYEGGVPIIRVGDLEEMMVNKSNLKRISPDIEKNYKRSRIVGDEILIGCVGSIGTIALADESLKGFNIVRATARVRINEQKANRLYIANHLNTSVIQNYFIKETRTVSQPTLNISHIEETPILLPPIKLQNQFATIAQNLQLQKQQVKEQIDQSDNLFKGLLQRAFKGELIKE